MPGRPLAVSIIGAGGEEASLGALARELKVDHRFHWHGEIPDARRLFGAFDVVALSSRREGTPIVLLEAVAAGVPVVATKVGGIPDVVSPREASLVPPEDPEALAAALRNVREDAGSAKGRAERARERLVSERGPAGWIDEHERIYQSVLPASRRRDET